MGVTNWIYDYRLPLDVVDGYETQSATPDSSKPISDPLTGLAAPSEVDREMEVRSEFEADSVCSSWDPSQVVRSGIFGDEPYRPLLPDPFRRRVVDWSAAQDQNFRGWDFDSLMLARGDFSRSDFTNAEMRSQNVWSAIFQDSILYSASIQYSGFRFVDFSGSDMRRLNGIKADLRDSKFNQSDLRGANLTYANLRDVTLKESKIFSTMFFNAFLEGASMVNVEGEGSCFCDARLEESTLIESAFNQASFKGADLSNARATGVDFRDVDFTDSDLSGTIFDGVDLRGAEIRNATLSDAVWTNTVCPDGSTNTMSLPCLGDQQIPIQL